MKVSRSPITIAQPSIFLLTLVASLQFVLSLTHSPSLQFRSPHPCSGKINPRSPTSAEREQSVSSANCASSCRVVAVGLPVVHCRTTLPPVTGPRNVSCPSTTEGNCLPLAIGCISALTAMQRGEAMFANMLSLKKKVTLSSCALISVYVWGPNQKGPVEPVIAAFAPTPPMQCNAAAVPYFWPLNVWLGLNMFPWVKSECSAAVWPAPRHRESSSTPIPQPVSYLISSKIAPKPRE